jgi:hypothetical protein
LPSVSFWYSTLFQQISNSMFNLLPKSKKATDAIQFEIGSSI